MRLGRLLLLLALVVVVAFGGYFIWNSTRGQTPKVTPAEQTATAEALATVPVVKLIQPVARGEVISEEKLAIEQMPKIKMPEVYFNAKGEVAGQVARFDLEQGVFITPGMLQEDVVGEPTGSEHAPLIPKGMVAFPVPINRFSGVAYGLAEGDRVGVIVTMTFLDLDTQFQSQTPNLTAGVLEPGPNLLFSDASMNAAEFNNIVAQTGYAGYTSPQGRAELDALLEQPFYFVPSEPQRPRLVSQMIMQNIVVLQVGTFPVYNEKGQEAEIATPTPDGQQEDENQQDQQTVQTPKVIPPDIVTLIMWPQEAITLNYLIYSGAEITLALRAAGDDSQTETDAVSLQYLMDVYRIPLPVRLPYGTNPALDELLPPVLENDQTDNN